MSSRGKPPGRSRVGVAEAGDDRRLQRRPRTVRRRSPCRCGRASRRAHARRWSARHGRSGWPMAPRPVRRRLRAVRARRGAPARARRSLSRPASARSAMPHRGLLWQHQRQRSRPERSRKLLSRGIEAAEAARRSHIGNVRDQRIECRPSLGGVEPRHGLAIAGIGAEPIDGLGREGDQPAFARGSAPPPRCAARRSSSRAFQARQSPNLSSLRHLGAAGL